MARLLAAVFLATMLTATLAAPMSEALLALLQAEPTPGSPVIRPQPSPDDPPVLVLDDDGDRRRMLNFYLQRALIQNDDPTALPPPYVPPPAPVIHPMPTPDIDIPPLSLDGNGRRMLNFYLQRAIMQADEPTPSSPVIRPQPSPGDPPVLDLDGDGLLHLYLQQAMAQNRPQGGQTARAQFDWGKLAGSALQTAASYYGRK